MSDYYRLDFTISPFNTDAADLLAAFLADAGFESFEQSETTMSAYIRKNDYSPQAVSGALEGFPFDVGISWQLSLIEHQDWNEVWEREFFRPLVLGAGRCVIHSSFHKDYPKAEIDIVVNPKMAFGTGHHATTSMMVDFLFGIDLRGRRVLDMGTGTGILAIVARKLGAGPTTGIEIDPDAYENALENVALNHADVLLLNGDARELSAVEDIDVFLANINRNIILGDLDSYVATLSSSGLLLLSGFYVDDIPAVASALKERGLVPLRMRATPASPSPWAAIMARKF